jgi:hypothetical protein
MSRRSVDPHQPVAVVKVGEAKIERENEIDHQGQKSGRRRVRAPLAVDKQQ